MSSGPRVAHVVSFIHMTYSLFILCYDNELCEVLSSRLRFYRNGFSLWSHPSTLMKHLTVVRGGLTYASYVRVICLVKSHADLIDLAVLFLASVFPEKPAKREGESGVFSSPWRSELQLSFRTCRFSAVRCRPPFLSLPNLPPRVLLAGRK